MTDCLQAGYSTRQSVMAVIMLYVVMVSSVFFRLQSGLSISWATEGPGGRGGGGGGGKSYGQVHLKPVKDVGTCWKRWSRVCFKVSGFRRLLNQTLFVWMLNNYIVFRCSLFLSISLSLSLYLSLLPLLSFPSPPRLSLLHPLLSSSSLHLPPLCLSVSICLSVSLFLSLSA